MLNMAMKSNIPGKKISGQCIIIDSYAKIKKMDYNSNNQLKIYRPKKHENMLTTTITTNSFEFSTHFSSVFERVIGPKIVDIKKSAFKSLKANKNIDPEVMMFINHCATIIQKQFRGYQQRKYYRMFLPVLWRFKQLLLAIVMGWRIRKIMKTRPISKKCAKIKQELKKNNLRDARIMKRELIDEIYLMNTKGKWLEHIQLRKTGNNQLKNSKKVILRSVLKSSSLPLPKINERVEIKQKKEQADKIEQHAQLKENRFENMEQQIPIKATGFYKIPQQAQLHEVSLKQEPAKPTRKNKQKKLTLQKRCTQQQNSKSLKIDLQIQIQNKNVEKQEVKQTNKGINKEKEQLKQKKIGENEQKDRSLSTYSIHLPMDEETNIQVQPFTHKTVRLDMKNLGQSGPNLVHHSSLADTQKIKRTGKGIKVTLSSSLKQPCQLELQSQALNATENHPKQTVSMMQPQPAQEDALSEIISVYRSTYSAKREQTASRYREMKQNDKFLQ